MQNLIVFCQRCFTWVETHADLCPECGTDVCLERPDPTIEFLNETLGTALAVLGPVTVERRQLPHFGSFVGTTAGFLFLPRLRQRTNGAWIEVTSQRAHHWWPFSEQPSSPKVLGWLRRTADADAAADPGPGAQIDLSQELLAERLMDSPGAFFLEHRFTRNVTARRRQVKFDRSPLRSIIVTDETKDGSLLDSVTSLIARAANERLRTAL